MRPPVRNRVLIATIAACALVLLSGQAATAGGPTSVILVSPNAQTTASFYASDSDYALLSAALEADPEPDGDRPPPLRAGPGSTQINVTWLVHDVSIWRIDHIFPDASGGPWIQTHLSSEGSPDAFGENGIWHRSPHPDQLLTLLAEHGFPVPGAKSNESTTPSSPAEKSAVVGGTEPGAPETGDPVPGPLTVPTVWMPVALGVGVVLGVAARPAFGAARSWLGRARARGPRQELIG